MRRATTTIVLLALILAQALVLAPVGAASQVNEDDEPAATEEAEGGEDDEEGEESPGDDEESAATNYESPTYGYTVEWEAPWEVEEEFSEDGYDYLQLGTPSSTLYLEGQENFGGDAQTCLDDTVEEFEGEPAFENLQPLEEDGEPVAGSDGDKVWAAYSFEIEVEGEAAAGAVYFECRALVPGEAALEITYVAGQEAYLDEFAGVNDILATLAVPAAAPADEEEGEDAEDDPSAAPGQDEEDAGAEEIRGVMESATESLDGFWTEIFEGAGLTYESPTVTYFDETVETGCGSAEPLEIGPFYCYVDQGIYMDMPFMEYLAEEYGAFPAALVVAHEWGHHVQGQLDIKQCEVSQCLTGSTSLEIELQADCLAGAWTSHESDNRNLEFGDPEAGVIVFADLLGDPEGTPIWDPGVHGPGSLRAYWYLRGFHEGYQVCLG